MWRFMCYRTTEPGTATSKAADQVLDTCVANGDRDEMTGAVLARGGDAEPLYSVWESVLSWARGEPAADQSISMSQITALGEELRSKGVENEPTRISAAYKLGMLCSRSSTSTDYSAQLAAVATATLAEAMAHSWEGVRRAATHGLIASGGHCSAGEQALLKLCVSAHP
jgi:hypothetical protein